MTGLLGPMAEAVVVELPPLVPHLPFLCSPRVASGPLLLVLQSVCPRNGLLRGVSEKRGK